MKRMLGIGCFAILLVGGLGGVLLVQELPDLFDWFLQTVEEEQAFAHLAEVWTPPSGEDPDLLFPEKVGDFLRHSAPEVHRIPGMEGLPGTQYRYQTQSGTLFMQMRRASRLEGEAMVGRIRKAYEGSGTGSKSSLEVGTRLECDSTRLGGTLAWWIQGWILVVHSQDLEDLRPFVRAYLGGEESEAGSGP